MTRTLALAAACAATLALSAPAVAAPAGPPPPAALDAGFGRDGIGELPPSGMFAAMDVAATPDGGAVVAGFNYDGGRHWVVKVDGDGRPDAGFGGGDGVAEVVHPDAPAGGANSDVAYSVAVDEAGRIVVLGDWGPSQTRVIAVARLLPDGRFDPSFDGDGSKLLALSPTARFSIPDALALGPDGTITVVGGWRAIGQPVSEPAKTTAVTLASDGTLLRGPGLLFAISTGAVRAAAVAPDGRLAFAGETFDDVMLLTRTSALLPLPGVADHRTTFPNSDGDHSLDAVAFVPGGSFVAVGNLLDDTTPDYTFSGLVSTFAPDGAVTHRRIHGLEDGDLSLHALGRDDDGLLAGGFTGYRNHHNQPAVVALTDDGAVDTARGGLQQIALPQWVPEPVDTGPVAFDADGHGLHVVHWTVGGVRHSGVARFDASPEVPGEPTDPRDPGEPTDPRDPGEPRQPTDPGSPRDPGQPGGPGAPIGRPGGDRPGARAPRAPRARFAPLSDRAAVRSLRGTVEPGARVVEVALVRRVPGTRRCRALRAAAPRFSPAGTCAPTRWLRVRADRGAWRLRLSAPLPAGRYVAWVRAIPRRPGQVADSTPVATSARITVPRITR